jgi:hypothetical protein
MISSNACATDDIHILFFGLFFFGLDVYLIDHAHDAPCIRYRFMKHVLFLFVENILRKLPAEFLTIDIIFTIYRHSL